MVCVASGHFFEREDKLPRSLVFGKLPGVREPATSNLPIMPFLGSYIFRENPQCRHLDEKSL